MRLQLLTISILCVLTVFRAGAQISPGDLAKSHAELEGMSNCTKCHVLGEKVSNDKCLDCHKEIKSRIDKREGYHYSKEVKGKDCAECHNDHHGRNFDMIHLDKDAFKHTLTGYELTGAHKTIDCRECHKPDLVSDRELRKRTNTYLGLDEKCAACHDDYHQATLSSTDCASCHTTEKFVPAEKFNHDKAKFPLLGKHKNVECIECHQKEMRNGQDFQRFADVQFSNCSSCHEDVHFNSLLSNCKECHTEESFDRFIGKNRFNHSRTDFPLKGKHKRVDCFQCHQQDATPLTVFEDRDGVQPDNCVACHEDIHETKFGNKCAECHNEDSFSYSGSMDNFNHNRTSFVLVGKHVAVDCRDCHTEKLTDPLPHSDCASCHTDYHESQFVQNGSGPDCAKCHTVDGFDVTLYTLEDHNRTKFQLDGAHMATPCFECHLQKEKWLFREIGEKCVDCHDDVHKGYLDSKYYPSQTCQNCHLSTQWKDNQFDHKLTGYQLEGAHAQQNCAACHGKDEQYPQVNFNALTQTCTECHDNVHDRQFEKNGTTSCESCHGFDNWDASKFDHDATAFKLDGKHVDVECKECHKKIEVDGKSIVQYKFQSFECVDCHN
ncbi:MAG: cytochrome c family protein [Saprospirales bacterium]|nr:cytochrome c family protein [Saprospirales bacterium]